ncbi:MULTISPECIES: 3'-5' ssDNA/RNA exonuclease TatD [Yersinia pseudotuberculosis complex]|uniref:3'-5' ssDNA/RNA exonuclease TatD n=1 Tax=Yersinia similis TaxID=367190 RepID=A0A0T9RLT4_9GAMM|nr:3'-5' ssDNA/RNA exonuclease TatD [Yersinia similis]AHK19495.1 DNase TatD [Yersinia similis]CFQ55190.1 DNase TatD [Yersinia similis]CNB38661.1 DNase TatD [Yersinia similis]CNE74600.1 DNase TatD [Yersinia similis]CNG58861.1 DNase TatD [Yersinia similis]
MFDIGVNLTSIQFAKDCHQVVRRAKEAGVLGILITGTDADESLAAQTLAAEYPGYCWSTTGVHPHHASSWQDSVEQKIRTLAATVPVVAIGECGLDFNRNFSTPAQQEIAFTAQLALAAELSLPVFLHCRDAHERFIDLLVPWLDKIPAAVVHCFTGNGDELDACLALGLSIGITGWVCDERRGLDLRALLPRIPVQQLLLETDAPYLLPRDLNPKPASRRNEPCFLPHIVQQVAAWRQEDPNWLGQKTDENARRVFRLV